MLIKKLVPVFALLGATACSEDESPPSELTIVEPEELFNGASLGEWGARSWQYIFAQPGDQAHFTDTADCSAGQTGDVWFLHGVNGEGSQTRVRSCDVPASKALYLAVYTIECDTAEGGNINTLGGDPFPTTPDGLRACANNELPITASVEIDGVAVTDPTRFITQGPFYPFAIEQGLNNVFSIPEGVYAGIPNNLGIIVKDLPVGAHTIHWHMEAPKVAGFVRDITWNLNVVAD